MAILTVIINLPKLFSMNFVYLFLTLGVRQGLSHNVCASPPRRGSGSWIWAFILCELDYAFTFFGDGQFSRENKNNRNIIKIIKY